MNVEAEGRDRVMVNGKGTARTRSGVGLSSIPSSGRTVFQIPHLVRGRSFDSFGASISIHRIPTHYWLHTERCLLAQRNSYNIEFPTVNRSTSM